MGENLLGEKRIPQQNTFSSESHINIRTFFVEEKKANMSSTTFVSCVFGSNTTEIHNTLQQWLPLQLYMVLYIQNDHVLEELAFKMANAPEDYRHIHCVRLEDIRSKDWAREIDLSLCCLPGNRNPTKDTLPHLWNTHHKIPCLATCVEDDPFHTPYYAFIDYDALALFQDPRTAGYLREHFGNTDTQDHKQLFLDAPDRVYIPGCWSPLDAAFVVSPEYKHNIHWRFCGAFVFGSATALTDFAHHYRTHFVSFVTQYDYCLSWEVNYWAWLEANTGWKPQWYAGNHNDTLVRVPKSHGFHILKNASLQYKLYQYMYPELSPYRPMSASYVVHNGRRILSTRYVNYWIYDNGAYWYPDDEQKIRTKNVCSLLQDGSEHHDALYPVCYYETKEHFQPPIVKRANVFSEGVEDIRLFVSNATGKLMFIGSTLGYSYTDRIRMIVGEYQVDDHTIDRTDEVTGEQRTVRVVQRAYMHSANVIVPPYDSWCEKNWAPIPLDNQKDGFVYKWNPLEIGQLVETQEGHTQLEIVHRVSTNTEIFGVVKGSTPFVEHDDGDHYIGMVHYSEEKSPRQYYNRLVLLRKETYEVAKCTETFCFEKVGVEFCVGMEVQETRIVFWISQKDRDPRMVVMDRVFFDDKWISF